MYDRKCVIFLNAVVKIPDLRLNPGEAVSGVVTKVRVFNELFCYVLDAIDSWGEK